MNNIEYWKRELKKLEIDLKMWSSWEVKRIIIRKMKEIEKIIKELEKEKRK